MVQFAIFLKISSSYPRTQIPVPPKAPGMSRVARPPARTPVSASELPQGDLRTVFAGAPSRLSPFKGHRFFSRNVKPAVADVFPVTRLWLSVLLNKRESPLLSLPLTLQLKLLAKCYLILKYGSSLKIVPTTLWLVQPFSIRLLRSLFK